MSLSYTELEVQNEVNLLGLLSNSAVDGNLRLYAAVLLYKRGSRFLAFQEWQPYKNAVLDYILQEHASAPAKPFAPNMAADVAGRLHNRLSDTNISLNQHADKTELAQGYLASAQQQYKEQHDAHAELAIRRLAEHDVQIHRVEKIRDEMDDQIVRNLDKYREEFLRGSADHDRALSKVNQDFSDRFQILDTRNINDNDVLKSQIATLKKMLWYAAPSLFVLSQIGSYLIKHFTR